MFLGLIAFMQAIEGALALSVANSTSSSHFELSAKAIGLAMLLDGLGGRIARMTNTTSDFGHEMDSLADVITFRIAPAVLPFAWGLYAVDPPGNTRLRDHLPRIGYFAC